MSTIGLVLAAGAGRRYGGPKALVPGWLGHAVDVLTEGGCDRVRAVIGAEVDRVRPFVPAGVEITVAEDWHEGMAASLRAGLHDLGSSPAKITGAVLHLVDLPDVTSAVVQRVLAAGADADDALVRAVYDSTPGHPVLIGRAHWAGVTATATGDAGARSYLLDHPHVTVECGDMATGTDVDRPRPEPTRDQPLGE